MTLQICPDHLNLLQAHAQRTYPHECCGLLLGTMARQDNALAKTVVEVRPVENCWSADVDLAELGIVQGADSSQADRYWIDPKTFLQVQRYARDRQLDIIGIYHSHPDHWAVPSECDRLLAWSCYSYLIIAVQRGIAQDLLCWSLDDHHQFQPEALLTLANSAV